MLRSGEQTACMLDPPTSYRMLCQSCHVPVSFPSPRKAAIQFFICDSIASKHISRGFHPLLKLTANLRVSFFYDLIPKIIFNPDTKRVTEMDLRDRT